MTTYNDQMVGRLRCWGCAVVIDGPDGASTTFPTESALFGKEPGTMLPVNYVRPVAYHRFATDRLLLKDESESWYLWMGDDAGLIEIDRRLAQWIYQRPEIYPVAGPAMWFDVDSLPVGSGTPTLYHD